MSQAMKQIRCRRCGEDVPLSDGNCPHCGARTGGMKGPLALIILGTILSLVSLLRVGDLMAFLVLGVVLVAIGAVLLHGRRKRINATEVQPE